MNKANETTTVATVDKEQKEIKGRPEERFSPVFVEAEKMLEKLTDITKETARNAYEFFQKRGDEFGKEIDDWVRAESRVLRPVAVEITESDGSVRVSAAVPGFKPEEIEISVKDDQLMMSGKTEKREEKEDESLVYSDWESNQFFRQLTLPAAVDPENVRAELKNGILELSLPKAKALEAKSIAVKAG